MDKKLSDFLETFRDINGRRLFPNATETPAIELVKSDTNQFIFKISAGEKAYILRVRHPESKIRTMEKEFDNLRRVANHASKHIVKPYCYHRHGDNELYVMRYYDPANCVKDLSNNIINSSMVALLVKTFDRFRNFGVEDYKVCDDFILANGSENEEPTFKTAFEKMKLTTARKLVKVSLNDYLDSLRQNLRVAMTEQEIENGIEFSIK